MTPDRTCATCGALESAHYTPGPNGALGLGHAFAVRAGDEWCSECEDWVVNGCGTEDGCRDLAEDHDRNGVWP